MGRSKCLFALFLLCSPFLSLEAQNFPKKPSGYINDFAGVLSGNDIRILNSKLQTYRDTTSNVIAVAFIKSLEGYSIDEYATSMFNEWKMWEGDRYNGVLLLISLNDRKMRFEVGYGLEGALTDGLAGTIIRDILQPNFRNQQFARGIDDATTAVMKIVAGEYQPVAKKKQNSSSSSDLYVLIFVILITIIISKINHGGGRRIGSRRSGGIYIGGFPGGFSSGRSSGFGGGGFGGFSGGGGFGSGGGGASGSW